MNTVHHTQPALLALGDSYTCAEGLARNQSWAYQLTAHWRRQGIHAAWPHVIAQTGWTTAQLHQALGDAAAHQQLCDTYPIVTVMCGVNDQYDGISIDTFAANLQRLLHAADAYVQPNGQRAVISIPDWGVTSFATEKGLDIQTIATAIDAFNARLAEVAASCGWPVIDVTDISRDMGASPDALAADGLHPSAKQLHAWAMRVATSLAAPHLI